MPRLPAPWYRTSRNRWYARMNGVQVPLDVTDPNDIQGAWAAFRKLLGLGESPAPVPAVVKTISALVPEYLSAVSHRVSSHTLAGYRSRLAWLSREFGTQSVHTLNPLDVERAANREPWSDGTRRWTLTVTTLFVRWSGRQDWRCRKPCPVSRGAEQVLSLDQFERVVSHCRGEFGPYLLFLWLTGCRPGEARTLTADAVDWQNGTASVREHKTRRRGKTRTLYLSGEALAVLKGQSRTSGHLFRRSDGKPFSRHGIMERWNRVAKLAGVYPLTCYCLRHSFATRALESGLSDTDVAALLGHSSTAILHRVYSHVSANARRLREVVSRVR